MQFVKGVVGTFGPFVVAFIIALLVLMFALGNTQDRPSPSSQDGSEEWYTTDRGEEEVLRP